MRPIFRAQLLGNSLGYYLVANRSILVSFEILRLRIGIMWSDTEERSNFGFLALRNPGIKRSKNDPILYGAIFDRLIAGAFS
ncbi:MAG: hypothetical protein H0W50_02750 [Parachlamydiaceae bacterium]|nr:hypothetical protein [Parachlamydiaceae bacterium]